MYNQFYDRTFERDGIKYTIKEKEGYRLYCKHYNADGVYTGKYITEYIWNLYPEEYAEIFESINLDEYPDFRDKTYFLGKKTGELIKVVFLSENNEVILRGMASGCTRTIPNVTDCSFCGELFTTNGEELCPRCIRETINCGECGNRFYAYDTVEIEETRFCCDCISKLNYHHCTNCDTYTKRDLIKCKFLKRNVLKENTICHRCVDNLKYCDYCDVYFEGRCYCYGKLLSYHATKPINHFGKGPEYFGIELEVEIKDGQRHSILSKIDKIQVNDKRLFHFEEDNSLNYGFEMVFQPMSWDYLLSRKKYINILLKTLRNNNCLGHDIPTCGLHIHVTRESLGDTEEERDRIIDNLWWLFETYKDELITFSRRLPEQIANFSEFLISPRHTIYNYKRVKLDKTWKSRYAVLNIGNCKTIEIRLWRSTLNENTFWATLELTKRLIEVSKYKNIYDVKWSDIANTKRIKQYCKERNITHVRKKVKEIIIRKGGE